MKTKIALLCILAIAPLLSLGVFTETVEGAYTTPYSVITGYTDVCKPWIAAGYGCHPTYWDHNAHKPCPPGMINCDDHAHCTSWGGPSACYDSVPVWGTAYTCTSLKVDSYEPCGATTFGFQSATASHMETVGGASCSDDPLTIQCCVTPTSSFTVNGSTGTTNVTQGTSFPTAWSLVGAYSSQYECSITTPAGSSPVSGGVSLSGGRDDTLNTLANPSTASTPYPYTFSCTHIIGSVCPPLTNTVNVTATALPFSIDAKPDGGSEDIGVPVNWKANTVGGYPPISYVWSGDVSGTTENISKMYGFVGLKQVTLNASDNIGQNKIDTGQINIVDNRIPQ